MNVKLHALTNCLDLEGLLNFTQVVKKNDLYLNSVAGYVFYQQPDPQRLAKIGTQIMSYLGSKGTLHSLYQGKIEVGTVLGTVIKFQESPSVLSFEVYGPFDGLYGELRKLRYVIHKENCNNTIHTSITKTRYGKK